MKVPRLSRSWRCSAQLGTRGGFVVRELLRRGIRPLAIARNAAKLAAAGFPESEVERRQATLDDAGHLIKHFMELAPSLTA
jgi:hypothetical protein